MKIHRVIFICVIVNSLSFSNISFANDTVDKEHLTESSTACVGYGPQTPRDIDNKEGRNMRNFALAPSYNEMNLCNIHFHNNAEHKSKDFSIFSGERNNAGYQCNVSKSLTKSELKTPEGDICNGLNPGDTVEVHWVHSSCDITPGKGLGSCL